MYARFPLLNQLQLHVDEALEGDEELTDQIGDDCIGFLIFDSFAYALKTQQTPTSKPDVHTMDKPLQILSRNTLPLICVGLRKITSFKEHLINN